MTHWEHNGLPVSTSVASYLGTLKKKQPPKKLPQTKPGEKPRSLPAPTPRGGDLNELVNMFKATGGMIQ